MAISVRIHPLHENGSQRVEVGGRLDTHTYGELDDRLTLVRVAKVQSLMLDLAQLDYISSAGVRSIFRARKLLAARGGTLVIANAQPQVQKVFDIVKAVPLSEIFRTVQEADAHPHRVPKKNVARDPED